MNWQLIVRWADEVEEELCDLSEDHVALLRKDVGQVQTLLLRLLPELHWSAIGLIRYDDKARRVLVFLNGTRQEPYVYGE